MHINFIISDNISFSMQCQKSSKQLQYYLQRAETGVVHIVCGGALYAEYYYRCLPSLNMDQEPVKTR